MKTLIATALATILAVGLGQTGAPGDVQAQIDHVFAKWNTPSSPGCAVGAAVDGHPVLAKAYGMADLEHDVRNTPETIFEAGSVSKQFTAAAVLLLVRDGKLSLDDPARKYVPELPAYGDHITIRHMLTHTSGLRDWGSIEAIAGWPRTSRAYTHAHVLDIVSRQRALNFTAGTRWSYSNTGYNLAAMIVSRLSGMSFAEFTRTRLFEPLGMTHTSWRDDFTRVVKNRAVAYADHRDGFHTEMPFENVHGNGGLLTTVGDLLTWNENFVAPRVGDAALVREQQERGRFSDGRPHGYALGLFIGTHKGVRQVDHGGATAGYRSHLARYPDQHLSVAVLCNVTSATATDYATEIADLYLGDKVTPQQTPTAAHVLTAAERERIAGIYRKSSNGEPISIVRDGDTPRIERGPKLISQSGSEFVTAGGARWILSDRGMLTETDAYGTSTVYERVAPVTPSADQLRAFAGTYTSDEAETVFTLSVEGDALVIHRRPDATLKLTPVYADAFRAPELGYVIFRRNAAGQIAELSVVQDRVWDLRFIRQQPSSRSNSQ